MEILQKKFPKKLTFSGNFNLFFITNQFFSFKINKKLLILNVKNGWISSSFSSPCQSRCKHLAKKKKLDSPGKETPTLSYYLCSLWGTLLRCPIEITMRIMMWESYTGCIWCTWCMYITIPLKASIALNEWLWCYVHI